MSERRPNPLSGIAADLRDAWRALAAKPAAALAIVLSRRAARIDPVEALRHE